jgi:hypothetical protein
MTIAIARVVCLLFVQRVIRFFSMSSFKTIVNGIKERHVELILYKM